MEQGQGSTGVFCGTVRSLAYDHLFKWWPFDQLRKGRMMFVRRLLFSWRFVGSVESADRLRFPERKGYLLVGLFLERTAARIQLPEHACSVQAWLWKDDAASSVPDGPPDARHGFRPRT